MKLAVFGKYMSAMGWPPAVLVIFLFLLEQGAAMGANLWLSKWSDDSSAANVTSKRDMYLGVYAAFGLAQGCLMVIEYVETFFPSVLYTCTWLCIPN